MIFNERVHNIVYEFCPHFIDDQVHANRPSVTKIAWVSFFMGEDSLGDLPGFRCGASDPE